MSIHFYLFHSIPVRFFPISIYSYPFLSISIHCIFLLVIQSKQNTMIRCSQPSHNAETKQHFESFRGILKCKPTHRGLFVVEQNEMEACFLEPPCQPAMAICQRKTTLQASKNNLPLYSDFIIYPMGQLVTRYFVHLYAHLPNCGMSLQIPCTMAPAVSLEGHALTAEHFTISALTSRIRLTYLKPRNPLVRPHSNNTSKQYDIILIARG